MKYLLWAAALFLSSALDAQDLASRIPNDAFAVATVNSSQFFELLPLTEFNQSALGQGILGKISQETKGQYSSVAGLGISLNSPVYLFSRMTDSISYYGMIVPLDDAAKLEQLLKGAGNNVTINDGLKSIMLADDESVWMWDEHSLLVLTGSVKSGYFENKDVAARYGLQHSNYGDYYGNAATTDRAVVVSEMPPLLDAATVKADSIAAEAAMESADSVAANVDSVVASDMAITDTATAYADTAYNDRYYDDYNKKYVHDDSVKNVLAREWVQKETLAILQQKDGTSILANTSFVKSRDSKALATVWLRNMDEIYRNFVPDIYTAMLGVKKGGFFTGLGSVNAKLFMDKEKIQISSEAEVSKELADSYRKIYKRKLNKQFLKYVDGEKAIGMLALSVNSQAYLEQLPALIQHTYSRLFPVYEQEIDLGASLFSLILDEKGLGKAVKGDGLMVLNGVTAREMTYTDYEYDENYNSKEVQKKRTEQVPDFLAMFSSDDTRLFEKLLNYGAGKGVLTEKEGIYILPAGKNPMELYFLVKDKMIFIGTSISDMDRIGKGQAWGSVSSADKALLTKNNMAILLKTSKCAGLLSDVPTAPESGLDKWKSMAAGMGDFYITSKPVKGNKIGGEFRAVVPGSDANGLTYLLRLFNSIGSMK